MPVVKTTPISVLKAALSEHLDAVRRGEEIIVTDRGLPIARIVPVEGATATDSRLARLVREGVVAPPRKPPSGRRKPPKGRRASGVLAALLAERAEGR